MTHTNFEVKKGWEPNSRYGSRLIFWRSWVRIRALYTGWTFFHIPICCKNCNVWLKKMKINKKRPGMALLKNKKEVCTKIQNKIIYISGHTGRWPDGSFTSAFEMACTCWDFKEQLTQSLMNSFMDQQCDQKKSPNVYKSGPKMISLEKLKILTPLQKLPKCVRFGQNNC